MQMNPANSDWICGLVRAIRQQQILSEFEADEIRQRYQTQVVRIIIQYWVMMNKNKAKGGIVSLKVIDVTNKEHRLEISAQTTGFQLKELVFKQLSKQLRPKEMRLTYEGAELANNARLSDFNVVIGNELVFKQDRIALNQVTELKVNNVEDPVFCEEYTYQWPCGHRIGQAGIAAHIRAVIAQGQTEIKCPFEVQGGGKCGFEWEYAICKKIGVFTAQERRDFETALAENYAAENFKRCPKCQQPFSNQNSRNRVRCPHNGCRFGDFCYRCLGPWTNPNSTDFCGNETCKFANEFLLAAPWDRVFSVKGSNGDKINVKTPKYRACPTCNSVIQNFQACKHTDCTSCKTKFCWICLQVNKGKWTCGSYGDYCGKVAQVQKFMPSK